MGRQLNVLPAMTVHGGVAVVTSISRPPGIDLDGVHKTFRLSRTRQVEALAGVDLAVAHREFVALVGPSGCGKSTLLRIAAGLESPSAGTVRIVGSDPRSLVAAHRVGVAFQDHALLPWLSVVGNLALPYRLAHRRVDRARITELIDLVGLDGFERARPKHLSGGMRQRVSMARALALEPDVLLLDEPFGALDAVTRRRLNLELQRIWLDREVTTLLVTHDVTEAALLADRVVVLSGRPGRIRDVVDVSFDRPRTTAIARTDAFHRLCDRLTADLDADDSADIPPEPGDVPCDAGSCGVVDSQT